MRGEKKTSERTDYLIISQENQQMLTIQFPIIKIDPNINQAVYICSWGQVFGISVKWGKGGILKKFQMVKMNYNVQLFKEIKKIKK